jgi:hypothetical protein
VCDAVALSARAKLQHQLPGGGRQRAWQRDSADYYDHCTAEPSYLLQSSFSLVAVSVALFAWRDEGKRLPIGEVEALRTATLKLTVDVFGIWVDFLSIWGRFEIDAPRKAEKRCSISCEIRQTV